MELGMRAEAGQKGKMALNVIVAARVQVDESLPWNVEMKRPDWLTLTRATLPPSLLAANIV